MEQTKDTGAAFTQLMYDMATSPSLTLPQAVEQLKRDARPRTLGETLAKYARIPVDDSKALQAFVVEKLLEHSPPNTKRDAVRRKVQMWLDGGVRSINKQGAIQLSFALGLSPEDADRFLHRTCGEGFHWRDPEEIVLLFALREGMTYPQALALCGGMAEKGLLASGGGSPDTLTELVRRTAENIADVQTLEEYLRQMKGRLGGFHNTAYALFREYLNLLCAPEIDDLLDPDPKISIHEVTVTYLHNALIPRVKRAAEDHPGAEQQVLSALQRDIRQNWPDAIALSRMLHRKTDVTRKALILLFLATDGETPSGTPDGDFPEDEPGFEDRYERINATLADCGFAPLDSRSPFDWMILYCMCIEEAMFIDSEVEAFLRAIFPQEPPEAEA